MSGISKQSNPVSRGRTNARSRKPYTAPIAVMFTASIAVARSARSLPTETMTKAQNEIGYPSPYHEPNTGSDGFDASVEVSW